MSRNPGLLSLGPLFLFVWFSLVTAPGYSSHSSRSRLLDLKGDHSLPCLQPPMASIRSRIQPRSLTSLLLGCILQAPFLSTSHAMLPSFRPSPDLCPCYPFSPLVHHSLPPRRQSQDLPRLPGHSDPLAWFYSLELCFFLVSHHQNIGLLESGLCLVHAALPAPRMGPDMQQVIKVFWINGCYTAFIKEREKKSWREKVLGERGY